MATITLPVEGMICDTCVANLNGVMRAMAGVNRLHVTLHPGQVEIDYDPDITGLDDFREAIEMAGFELG